MVFIFYLIFLVGLLSGVLSAVFYFIDSFQTADDRQKMNELNKNWWEIIEQTRFRELPQIGIQSFFKLASLSYLLRLTSQGPLVSWIGKKNRLNWLGSATLAYVVIGTLIVFRLSGLEDVCNIPTSFIFFVMQAIVIILVVLLISANIKSGKIELDSDKRWYIDFGIPILLSVFATFVALNLGDLDGTPIVASNAYNILSTNFACDFLTVLITYDLLSKAVAKNQWWYYLLTIFLDLILSAVLAVVVLLVVVLTSDLDLSPLEIIYTLVGLDKTGTNWNFDGWFFLMHTTFVPTALYLGFILMCLVAKAIVIPISKIFQLGTIAERPHVMTSRLFGLIATVMGAVLAILSKLEYVSF